MEMAIAQLLKSVMMEMKSPLTGAMKTDILSMDMYALIVG